MKAKVRTCLWFDGNGEEAAEYYVSLLPGSAVEAVFRPEPDGPALVVDFSLAGSPYQALNGGPQFPFTEAASISVLTRDQAETDRLWNALVDGGGAESMCGWCKDRYGLSWQIVPEPVTRMLSDTDTAAAGRAMEAVMQMRRIDIAAVDAAFENVG